jgi:hypothetical protein
MISFDEGVTRLGCQQYHGAGRKRSIGLYYFALGLQNGFNCVTPIPITYRKKFYC